MQMIWWEKGSLKFKNLNPPYGKEKGLFFTKQMSGKYLELYSPA